MSKELLGKNHEHPYFQFNDKLIHESASGTSLFLKLMNDLFDILNNKDSNANKF